ncbi:MAG TPA: hypothetical protein VFH66_11910 [Mycobacteriales bacterium]|nr:hypothetical protein [Mycobacteriales bacterium]
MTDLTIGDVPPPCHACGGAIDRAKILMWPDGIGTVLCDSCGTLALIGPEDDLLRER